MWPFGVWHLPPWMGRVKTAPSLKSANYEEIKLIFVQKNKSEKSRESEKCIGAHPDFCLHPHVTAANRDLRQRIPHVCYFVYTGKISGEKNLHHEIRGRRSRGCGRNSCYGRTKAPDRHFRCLDLRWNICTWPEWIRIFTYISTSLN